MQCCSGFRNFVIGFVVCLGLFGLAWATSQGWNSAIAAQEQSQDQEATKMLRHVVLFKFKDEAFKEDVQKVVDAFRELPGKIPEIADFEYGTDNSPEGLADGFTHCFLVSFKSEEAREVYLPHPAHQEFVEVLEPHLDKVLVVDYWTKK